MNANIDVEILHAIIRARELAHVTLLAAHERVAEDRAEIQRLEGVLARQRAEVNNGRGGRFSVVDPPTIDHVAVTETALGRARAAHERALGELALQRERWNATARLADRCTRYAHRHCPGVVDLVANVIN